jgi:Zinc finger, C3HC4 type (RING finger)
MDEPISHPIRLPECGHAFCFTCIRSWQETSSPNKWATIDSENGCCPLCRTVMAKSAAECAVFQAQALQVRASKLLVEQHDEKMKLLHMAVSECNHVLDVENENVAPMMVKISALAQFDPHETIKATNELMQLDAVVRKKQHQLKERFEEMINWSLSGRYDLAGRLQNEIDAEYGNESQWPKPLGTGEDSLFEARICMAKAYEAIDRWHDAAQEYGEMLQWYETADPRQEQDDLVLLRSCREGYARCALHFGDCDEALSYSLESLGMCRQFEGSHKLVAQAQRALARQTLCTTRAKPFKANWTLMDAVETMYRAMVHEAPWNDANRLVNRAFLQELLEELEAEEK